MQQQQTERWTQQMQQMYERVAEWLKGFWQTLCTLWQDPHKRVRLMVAAGFAGMGLILCSRLCQPPKDEGRPMAAAQTTETAPEASLEQQLAENLGRMLGQLEGAGEWVTLQRLLPDFTGKRVLDLGCGYGWHCAYAAQKGAASVRGVDLSEKMLETAREKNSGPVIQYRRAAMED